MDTAQFRKHALLPKCSTRRDPLPVIPALPDWHLAEALTRFIPAEKKALAQIVDTADLAMLNGATVLVVPATPALLDALAAFGAEIEDCERDYEDEVEQDNDSDSDNALDAYDPGMGTNDCGDRILHVITDDYEPDAPEGGPPIEDVQPLPILDDVVPVTTMPEPPPIATHARPAEFGGRRVPALATHRQTERLIAVGGRRA